MSRGFGFRSGAEHVSLKTTLGAALIGGALLTGSFGSVTAQESSPAACAPVAPVASPAAAPGWITDILVDTSVEAEGDSTTVGVSVGEVLEINVAEFQTRPTVQFQIANSTDAEATVVVLSTPAEFDAACFMLPADAAELPEGVAAVGAVTVPAAGQVTAPFTDLAEGSYLLATNSGLTLPFTVLPQAEVEVPDIFASPES